LIAEHFEWHWYELFEVGILCAMSASNGDQNDPAEMTEHADIATSSAAEATSSAVAAAASAETARAHAEAVQTALQGIQGEPPWIYGIVIVVLGSALLALTIAMAIAASQPKGGISSEVASTVTLIAGGLIGLLSPIPTPNRRPARNKQRGGG
jgi:hypothetical protein